jgi:hypothetical protein
MQVRDFNGFRRVFGFRHFVSGFLQRIALQLSKGGRQVLREADVPALHTMSLCEAHYNELDLTFY